MALLVAQLATLIPAYQDSFAALADDLRVWLGSLGVGPDQLQAALGKISFANVAALVADLLAGVAAVFSNMLFLLFVVAFMAIDATGFSRRGGPGQAAAPDVVGALGDEDAATAHREPEAASDRIASAVDGQGSVGQGSVGQGSVGQGSRSPSTESTPD